MTANPRKVVLQLQRSVNNIYSAPEPDSLEVWSWHLPVTKATHTTVYGPKMD